MLITLLLLSKKYIIIKFNLIYKKLNLEFNKVSTLFKYI